MIGTQMYFYVHKWWVTWQRALVRQCHEYATLRLREPKRYHAFRRVTVHYLSGVRCTSNSSVTTCGRTITSTSAASKSVGLS